MSAGLHLVKPSPGRRYSAKAAHVPPPFRTAVRGEAGGSFECPVGGDLVTMQVGRVSDEVDALVAAWQAVCEVVHELRGLPDAGCTMVARRPLSPEITSLRWMRDGHRVVVRRSA